MEEGDRVIVNRIDCDYFGRGDIIVFADSVVIQRKNQRKNQLHKNLQGRNLQDEDLQDKNMQRDVVSEAYFIGRIEKLPGDTITLDSLRYIIPTVCCKRCGCKDCRFYLVRTSRRGQQLVHKHQMIGKAYKLF